MIRKGTFGAALFVFSVCAAFVACVEDSSTPPPLGFDGGVLPGIDAGEVPGPDADRTEPDTTITAKPAALSNQATPTFEFTSNRPGRFACRVDTATPADCISPFTFPVTEGAHTFEVSAVSKEGVADPSPATHAWSVDLTPPVTTIGKAPPAIDNSTTVEFDFTASEEATFRCALDGAAPTECAPPVTVTVASGAHTFAVFATDTAGNVELAPVVHAWTVDTTVPDTTIVTGPTGSVSSTTATFTFTSPNAGAGATYTCSLDGAAFAACTSPKVLSGLSQGSHTFAAKVTSASSAADPTPAQRTWTVDTVAPTVTITGGPTGSINDTTPTFTFTTAAGATGTSCRIGAAAFAPCTSPFTPAALGNGSFTFEVRAVDGAGNTASATRAFVVDTLAPTVSITGGPAGPTNDATPTFTFTTASGATSTACRIDAAAFAPCTSPFTVAALGNGSFTFEVRATDVAGNTASATRAFSVDTVAPTVTITTGPSGPTNDPTPTFTFTTAGAVSTQCRLGAAAFAACVSPYTTAALGNGAYTLEVRALDAAGNPGFATRAFSVDLVAPSVTITSGPTGQTNNASPTFAFTTGGGPVTTSCRLDTGAFGACTSPYAPGTLSNGPHTIEVRATDAAGNFAQQQRSFTVDIVAPVVTITAGPNGLTTDNTPAFSFTVTGATTIQCRIGTGAFTTCASSYTSTPLGEGTNTFEVRGTDAAANVTSATRTFTVDTIPPGVTITGGPSGPTNNTSPSFTFTTSGAAVLTECRLNVIGGFAGTYATCTSPYATGGLNDGQYQVEVRARDAAGNSASTTQNFSIDTAGPSITMLSGPGQTAMASETFTWSMSSDATAQCRIYAQGAPSGTYAPCASPYTTAMPSSWPALSANWTLEVLVTDPAGNTAVGYWQFNTYIIT